jgi:hypothetical protein
MAERHGIWGGTTERDPVGCGQRGAAAPPNSHLPGAPRECFRMGANRTWKREDVGRRARPPEKGTIDAA